MATILSVLQTIWIKYTRYIIRLDDGQTLITWPLTYGDYSIKYRQCSCTSTRILSGPISHNLYTSYMLQRTLYTCILYPDYLQDRQYGGHIRYSKEAFWIYHSHTHHLKNLWVVAWIQLLGGGFPDTTDIHLPMLYILEGWYTYTLYITVYYDVFITFCWFAFTVIVLIHRLFCSLMKVLCLKRCHKPRYNCCTAAVLCVTWIHKIYLNVVNR